MILRRIALGACFFVLMTPSFVLAENVQADMQCPPGGTVGQSCKDMTSGFVTSGHCTHVGVCKADSWNTTPPKGCGSSGNINAPTADCPKAPPISGGKPTPQTGTTTVITVGPDAAVNSDIFDNAFSDQSESVVAHVNTVSTTTLDGIEYFISGGEALAAGSLLTEEVPASAQVVPSRSSLALGSVYDLRPAQQNKIVPVSSAYGQDYRAPIAGFNSGSANRGGSEQVNFADQFAQLWSGTFNGVSNRTIDFLFFASALTPPTSPLIMVTGPYENMYRQVDHAGATFFQTRAPSEVPGDYLFVARLQEVRALLREAFLDIGTAASKLVSGDTTASSSAVGSAAWKTAQAFGLLGNVAASVALRVVLWN